MAACLGIAALVAAAVPARAADPTQGEGGTTIDGRYLGTIQTTQWDSGSPPMVDTGADCDWTLELNIGTDPAGGGLVSVWINCIPLSYSRHPPSNLSLTWDGTAVAFRWEWSEGFMEWSGTVTRTDDTVTISGTFTGQQVDEQYAGVWEVTRVADTAVTSSTTQPAGGGGEVTTTAASVSSVPSEPAGEGGETPAAGQADASSAPPGGVFERGGWSPAGVAILILFLILIAIALGIPVKAAVAAALVELPTWIAKGPPSGQNPPSAGDTATLALNVQFAASGSPTPVTVSGPVEPWSGPEMTAPRSGFVLQPGQGYTVVGSTGPGPDAWVLLQETNKWGVLEGGRGWVHRSTLEPWQEEIPMTSEPAPTTAWENVHFNSPFDTRDHPGGNYERRDPGDYRLGAPDASGYRQVTDAYGRSLGTIHASKVPPPANQPTGGVAPNPPPPPPPPPPPGP